MNQEDQARRWAEELLSDEELSALASNDACYTTPPKGGSKFFDLAKFVREAIAAALVKLTQQEPVFQAQLTPNCWSDVSGMEFVHFRGLGTPVRVLYTNPALSQQEDRKPLTDAQKQVLWGSWFTSPCEDDWHGRREAERLEAAYMAGLRDAANNIKE